MRQITLLAAFLAACGTASVLNASLVQATFNDLNTGQLNAQAGGTGFAAENWTGASSTTIQVVNGDLTAPASTHFALTQSGTARSVEARSNTIAERQRDRGLAASMTGDIWISFLVNVTGSETAGIGLNVPAANSSFNNRPALLASGTDLVYDPDRANAITGDEKIIASGVITPGADTLILARLVIDGVNSPTLSVWVNPDLTALPDQPTLSVPFVGIANTTAGSFTPLTSLDRIAVGGLPTSSSAGGNIDFLTLSNNPSAYTDVTGVELPEPASLSLLAAAGGLAIRRRKPTRG